METNTIHQAKLNCKTTLSPILSHHLISLPLPAPRPLPVGVQEGHLYYFASRQETKPEASFFLPSYRVEVQVRPIIAGAHVPSLSCFCFPQHTALPLQVLRA